MKVLYVSSGNSHLYKISPFINEQAESVSHKGIFIEFFTIEGKGFWGYLKNLRRFYKKIKQVNPDIIHAHYGLSGLFANTQRRIPVITTYHGSDINDKKIRIFSLLAHLLSKHSIFVSKDISQKVCATNRFSIVPCSIDLATFYPMDKNVARALMNFKENDCIILFSSSFNIPVKNFALARAAINLLQKEINLIELQGYTRDEVNILLNACDVALLTSKSEGSPQFIKEAMACNRPIVSTDVGDAKLIIKDTKGCFVTSSKPDDVAKAIQKALDFNKQTDGREKVKKLSSDKIAEEIIAIYSSVAIESTYTI